MSMLAYCMNILMSLMMLSMVFVMISMSAASARRVAEVLNEETSLSNPEHPITEVKDGSGRIRAWSASAISATAAKSFRIST